VARLLPNATQDQLINAQRWIEGQYQEIRSSLSQADAEIAQRNAEIHTAKATVERLVQTLPITRQLSADYKKLAKDLYVPQHAYLEKEQARLDQERELTVQQARVLELAEARRAAQERKASLIAQARRELLDMQHEAEARVAAFSEELKKAEQRGRLTKLTAPVDGTIQQLAIHTAGGVVTEAQPLMVIVPSDQPVEVEAMLENKDIGFVRPGQEVEVKVDTFNFTKYGVVHGTVVSVSNDAIEDERLGLVYSARIQLSESKVLVGSQHVPLSPGMAIRAEVKTDTRKVIDYFLSPLQQYVDESLAER
jgi:hemolysin D